MSIDRGKERATYAARHHMQEVDKLVPKMQEHLHKARSFATLAKLQEIDTKAADLLRALEHFRK